MSKEARVNMYGEVFTPPNTTKDIIDLLGSTASETKIQVLEPACGEGIFLIEILERKLFKICTETDFKRLSLEVLKSLHGIDILSDNVEKTRDNLYAAYQTLLKRILGVENHDPEVREIIENNIVCADFLKSPVNRKYDIIISNPPYQTNEEADNPAKSVTAYCRFIFKSLEYDPTKLVMIIPSKWMIGGEGAEEFRKFMLNNTHLRVLHDFYNSQEIFPSVAIDGGICYFIHDKEYNGPCKIYFHDIDGKLQESFRFLKTEGLNTFVRYSDAIPIIDAVRKFNEKTIEQNTSPKDPFGLNYYAPERRDIIKDGKFENSIAVYCVSGTKRVVKYVDRKYVGRNEDWIDKYKVCVSKANGSGIVRKPFLVISKPFLLNPGEICSISYLVLGAFDTKEEAMNLLHYVYTKFFRFLTFLLKTTRGTYKRVYGLVPAQNYKEEWTDAKLYNKYRLTDKEIDLIESTIREMN